MTEQNTKTKTSAVADDVKHCAVCLTLDHAADVETCPHCGEASWVSDPAHLDRAPVAAPTTASVAAAPVARTFKDSWGFEYTEPSDADFALIRDCKPCFEKNGPCSPEHFKAAGYDPKDFDAYCAKLEERRVEREKEREAAEKDAAEREASEKPLPPVLDPANASPATSPPADASAPADTGEGGTKSDAIDVVEDDSELDADVDGVLDFTKKPDAGKAGG